MTQHRLKTMQELGRMNTAQFKEADKYPLCIILDNVRTNTLSA